jgi:Gram-negative bacterial TonB protein C-terminal
MRQLKLHIILNFLSLSVIGQNSALIYRDWVKVSIENLSDRKMVQDNIYLRYSFSKSKLVISINPGWNDYNLDWNKRDNNLKVGYDTYKIEQLDDTALTISLAGFRRIKFLAEDFLNSKEEYLDSIGQYDGKALFKANNFITPRYKGVESFREYIDRSLKTYRISKATHFLATFIVTEEGEVENVIIHKSIMKSFDETVVKSILKTSKKWTPALFKGVSIQTQMVYEIRYLDSIAPYD